MRRASSDCASTIGERASRRGAGHVPSAFRGAVFGRVGAFARPRFAYRLDPSFIGEFDKFIAAHPVAPPDHLAVAFNEKGRACLRLKQADKAGAAFDAVLRLKGVSQHQIRLAMIGKADAKLLKKDTEGAIAVYRQLLHGCAWPFARGVVDRNGSGRPRSAVGPQPAATDRPQARRYRGGRRQLEPRPRREPRLSQRLRAEKRRALRDASRCGPAKKGPENAQVPGYGPLRRVPESDHRPVRRRKSSTRWTRSLPREATCGPS